MLSKKDLEKGLVECDCNQTEDTGRPIIHLYSQSYHMN